ncbi:mannosyltransferase family protein [Actinoplanes sp. KI2]|uniref:mannosyltransferase family protein n=1 Tax=Actinoplanes sp. KI2 TaxID=2983315 RepID=UPI0021D5E260|nr:mannosyltransferase family protein [Actinoplanes sp. KI2]MCU7723664.1 mannosyltransferase family protein [Actinoplanes sp. KI2]
MAEERPVRAQDRPLWELAGAWRGVLTAVGIFALTRIAQLLMLAWLGHASGDGESLRSRLLVWDGGWFLRVAVNGYPHGYTYGPQHQLEGNELAFFPLYPMLIRGVAALGVSAQTAAIGVSWLASIGAAVALHLLGTTLYGKRAGWALVAICCSAPVSVVLSMAYTEALFIALVAGMLAAAHRKVWWAAGLLGLGCALTRPTGAAAALALAVAAVMAVRESPRKAWQPVLAAVVALAGVPLFLIWVGARVGDPAAWFRIQTAGWGTSFDFGRSTWQFLRETLTTGDGWVPMSVALMLLVALAAAGVALAGKPWLPLAVYGVVAMVLVYGQAGFYHSKPRLLLPVLLTLLPAAVAAARARPRVAVLSIVAWAAFGLWYGAYLVAIWPYTL